MEQLLLTLYMGTPVMPHEYTALCPHVESPTHINEKCVKKEEVRGGREAERQKGRERARKGEMERREGEGEGSGE